MRLLLNGLSLVFVVAKVFGLIGWSWWAVFIPTYIYIVLVIILITLAIILEFLAESLEDK